MTAKNGRAMIKKNSRYERILATMAGVGRAKNRSEKAWNLFVLYNQRITAHPCTIKAHNHLSRMIYEQTCSNLNNLTT